VLHAGYWGPHVGFYGGINYGFGYGGVGYEGGYWEHGVFNYSQTVNNFGSISVTTVYNKAVINNTSATNVSFNGGTGGTTAQPTAEQEAAAPERHTPATPVQAQHEHVSSTNHALLASVNHGQPAIGATSRPGELQGHGVVGTRGATGETHAPRAMHAPGEPGAQHAVSPATSHPPGHPNGGVPPHQTNATPQHALGNVNTPRPANAPAPHSANAPPRHPANAPAPHPTNQARINPGGMTHPPGGAMPHPTMQARPPTPRQPPPHPPAHAAGGNQNKKPQ
jgi:hypothetical protein